MRFIRIAPKSEIPLRRLDAPSVRVNGVERRMATDVETVALRTAEADVSNLFGNGNFANELTACRNAVDPVAGARPDVALDIDSESVGNAGRNFREHAAVAQLVVRDVEGADVVGPVRVRPEAGIRDVKQPFVGREGESIRTPEVVCDDAQRAVPGVTAIDVTASDFTLRLAALVGCADAVAWVGKPHGAVRFHNNGL